MWFCNLGSCVDSLGCNFDLVCKLPYWDTKITWTFASSDPRAHRESTWPFTFALHEKLEGKLTAVQTAAGIP